MLGGWQVGWLVGSEFEVGLQRQEMGFNAEEKALSFKIISLPPKCHPR
jgi:hypothetical protein